MLPGGDNDYVFTFIIYQDVGHGMVIVTGTVAIYYVYTLIIYQGVGH